MGLGPSTKMTTRHHMACPVTRCVLAAAEADCAGVLINGLQFPVFLTPLQVLDGAIHSMV